MIFTKNYLIEDKGLTEYDRICQDIAKLRIDKGLAVYSFYELDDVIYEFFNYNGGDEEYIIVCSKNTFEKEKWMIERIARDLEDYADTYELDDIIVIVTSHG